MTEDVRLVPRNIGDKVSAGSPIIIDDIASVVPVKYNGIDDTFEVCRPEQATHDIIVSDDDYCIAISKNCLNRESIIDIL